MIFAYSTFSQTEERNFPTNIYLLKVNSSSSRKRCEISSDLTIKTPERCQ